MTSQVDSLYRIAGQLHRRSGGPAWLPALWFLTDSVRVKDPEAVIESLPAGCGVIFRDYERPDRAGLAHSLSALTRERDCLFLVAGDAALAKACRADGVHLPEHRLEQAKMIRQNGIRLMTAATHDKASLIRAGRNGVDAAFLSPVFATQSHPGAASLGPARFAALIGSAALPVYALGGVNMKTAPRLKGTGAAGIGVIGALAGS